MEMALSTVQGPRDDNIVPLLYLIVFLCVAMSVMLFAEKVYMAIIILVKLIRKRPGGHPERQYIWEPIRENDEIVVKIPVFNENEVYQLSIGAACRVSWTSDRIIIQMLDDSTDPVIKEHNREEEVMEDENERNQEEEIRTTEEKEDENERNQERTTEEKEDENERNQEEEITEEKEDENERDQEEEITEEKEDENERDQEEEIRTTEEKKRRKRGGDERESQAKRRKKAEGTRKRGGDTLGERKSQAKRRKIEGRKKRKQQCRWVWSCMAMGCAAIFTSALIYLFAANILEEETIYLVPT